MAFTQAEKAKLLFYLGYSGFEDDGPAIRAINGLDSHEKFMGPIIRDLLDKLNQVDIDIHASRPLAKAISTGGVETRAHYTLDHLWRLGRSYVVRLGRFTKIMISGDVFGTGGSERSSLFYSGDPSEKRINPDVGMPTIGDFGSSLDGSGGRY